VLFPEAEDNAEVKKEGAFFRNYKKMMRGALHIRWLVIPAAVGLLVTAVWARNL